MSVLSTTRPHNRVLVTQPASFLHPQLVFLTKQTSAIPGTASFCKALQRSRNFYLYLKILPLVFDSFHKLFETLLATDVFEDRVKKDGFSNHFRAHILSIKSWNLFSSGIRTKEIGQFREYGRWKSRSSQAFFHHL